MQDESSQEMKTSNEAKLGRMLGKIVITGKIGCLTGLHIGGPGGELEIGGIDNPVIRDPVSDKPYIPGSSLKGKLRSLLERHLYHQTVNGITIEFNRSIGKGGKRHECNTAETASNCPICRLFGSTGKKEGGSKEDATNFPSLLLVRDCYLENADKLKDISSELLYTEWKTENTLDRVTAASNPRNIERVPRGSIFSLEIIYTILDGRQGILKEDLENLLSTFKMLELDALGGNGSRGYGKVAFEISELKLESFAQTREEEKKKIEDIITTIKTEDFKLKDSDL